MVPADRKWFARICTGAIIADALVRIDPQYPAVGRDARESLARAKTELEAEGGRTHD